MLKSLVCMFVSLFAITLASPYKDCGSVSASVNAVSVTNCPDSATFCLLKRGTSVVFDVTFSEKDDASSAKAVVYGIVAGVKIPFTPPQPDACKDSGLTCPLKAGQNLNYSSSIPIEEKYPKLDVIVVWSLQDQNQQDIFCVGVPCKIVD